MYVFMDGAMVLTETVLLRGHNVCFYGWQDGSTEGSKCMFLWTKKENYPYKTPGHHFLSGALQRVFRQKTI